MKTAYDLVWIAGERTPDHLALVDDRTDRELTYRQLLAEVDSVAAGLAARGIRAGSRVATILPNLFEHCIALLALQRLAAVPALMNARLQPAELAKLIIQGEIEGAIIRKDEPLAQEIAPALPPGAMLLSVDGAIGNAEDFATCRDDGTKLPAAPRPEPGSTAFIFYTSGTMAENGATTPSRGPCRTNTQGPTAGADAKGAWKHGFRDPAWLPIMPR